MELRINRLPKSQAEMEIELPNKEFNKFIEQAILNLNKDLEIKGFRKGKAPKEIVEKEVGPEKILMEAADLAVKENYKKAVLESGVEVISQPEIRIKEMPRPASPLNQLKAAGEQKDPFIFSAKVTVLPEIKLPDYKRISRRAEKKPIKIEDKEVEAALKWLQRSRAKLTIKNQPAGKGDFVEIEYWSPQIDLSSKVFGPADSQNKGQKDAFILGEGRFIPGFEEQLTGMKTGEEKEGISITVPENHPVKEIAGKEIEFKVKMDSVQNVELPEINDQFAVSLGKFKNLIELRENIKTGLVLEKKQAESQRVRTEILEKISQDTECEVPEVLVQQEQRQMLEKFKKNAEENLKISFSDYLSKIKKTEQQILDSFLPQSQRRVKNFLILREIDKKEKIEVSEQEIEEETNKILKQYPSVEGSEKNIDPERLKEYTKDIIRTEKTLSILEGLAKEI